MSSVKLDLTLLEREICRGYKSRALLLHTIPFLYPQNKLVYCLTKVIHEYDVFTESKYLLLFTFLGLLSESSVEVALPGLKILIIIKCMLQLITLKITNHVLINNHKNLLRYCILTSSFLTSLELLSLLE